MSNNGSIDGLVFANRSRAERAVSLASQGSGLNPEYVSTVPNQKPTDYVPDTGIAFGAYPTEDDLLQKVLWNDDTNEWDDFGEPVPLKGYVDTLVDNLVESETQEIRKNQTLRQFISGRTAQTTVFNGTDDTKHVYYGGTSVMSNLGGGGLFEWLKDKYGDANNVRYNMFRLGGIFGVSNGWEKQGYGGLYFGRAVGVPTSDILTYEDWAKKVVIRYSTESVAEASSFQVDVNGVIKTINCSGSQSFNNETVWDLGEATYAEVIINPPSTGQVYLEAVEFINNDPGIDIINGSLGGSALNQKFNEDADYGSRGSIPGIALEGFNAIDSEFGKRTESYNPEAVIFGWMVNDAGNGINTFENEYKPAFQRLYDHCKAHDTPIIIVIEMGGHYNLPSDSNADTFQAIRDYLYSFAQDDLVTIVDWDAATVSGFEGQGLEEYIARYYAGTYDHSTGDTTGDLIHPDAGDRIAEKIAAQMLAHTFGVDAKYKDLQDDRRAVFSLKSLNKGGYSFTSKNNQQNIINYTSVGTAIYADFPAQRPITAYSSPNEINYLTDINEAIQAGTDENEYGKYKEYNQTGLFNIDNVFEPNEAITITFVASATTQSSVPSITFDTIDEDGLEFRHPLTHVYDGKEYLQNRAYIIDESNLPKLYTVTVRANAAGKVLIQRLNGVFYGFWVTRTIFPVIATATEQVSPQTTTAFYADGDSVKVGDIYLSGFNDIVRKEAVGIGYEWPSGDRLNLFRCLNPEDTVYKKGTLNTGPNPGLTDPIPFFNGRAYYTDLEGFEQRLSFDTGNNIAPGTWYSIAFKFTRANLDDNGLRGRLRIRFFDASTNDEIWYDESIEDWLAINDPEADKNIYTNPGGTFIFRFRTPSYFSSDFGSLDFFLHGVFGDVVWSPAYLFEGQVPMVL